MICRLGTTKATYIRQFEINGLIDSEGNITSPLFDRANHEQSAKQPIEGTLFEVIDGQAIFNESLGWRIDQLNVEPMDDLGYHGGNLMDKSDYLTQGYSGDMPYTGYYFFSDRERAEARGNRSTYERQVTSVDFSKYNLFRPTTAGYWNLKATLKEITRDMLQGKPFDLSRYGPSDFGSFDIYNELNDKKEEVRKAFKDFKESLKGNFKVERFETTMMKMAGYEGIDVRGLPGTPSLASPDSSSEGSVIFDLKEGTVGELETISSPELPTLTKPIGFKSNCK